MLVAASSISVALAGSDLPPGDAIWLGGGLVLVQALLAAHAFRHGVGGRIRRRIRRRLMPVDRSLLRLLLSAAVIALLSADAQDPTGRALAVLHLPLVVVAAGLGTRPMLAVTAVAATSYLAPYAAPGTEPTSWAPVIPLALVMLTLGVGTRQGISLLVSAVGRLRRAVRDERRQARQLLALEDVGRLLVATGPTPATLDAIMALLSERLHYPCVSIYLRHGHVLRLGAYRGYDATVDEFDGTAGVIGRVMRERTIAFVPDVTLDPDYVSANAGVRSEICAPLLAHGELLGVINVESDTRRLDESDGKAVALVADRLASALALAEERRLLDERALLLSRLTTFSARLNESFEPAALYPAIANGAHDVVDADHVVLTALDRSSGQYRIVAASGGSEAAVGVTIGLGEGIAGRAIRDRALVVDDRFERARYPAGARDMDGPDEVTGLGVPLVRDDVVVGALTLVRRDVARPFGDVEQEIALLLAGQVALAVSNSFLHADLVESAVRDPLTGLHNRRYLEAALERLDAVRERLAPDERPPVAAVLFDLDRFGAFNKRYGHRTGDAILQEFARALRARLRGEDLVARYGGEEFLVVLEGVTMDNATRLAEDIRERVARTLVPGPDGEPLRVIVSAGCAGIARGYDSVADLLARADVGLAMAKHAGRNQVVAA